jgi:hypothetical protein
MCYERATVQNSRSEFFLFVQSECFQARLARILGRLGQAGRQQEEMNTARRADLRASAERQKLFLHHFLVTKYLATRFSKFFIFYIHRPNCIFCLLFLFFLHGIYICCSVYTYFHLGTPWKDSLNFVLRSTAKLLAKLYAVPVAHEAQIELDQFPQKLSFQCFSVLSVFNDIQGKIIYESNEIREVWITLQ